MRFIKVGEIVYVNGLKDYILEEVDINTDDNSIELKFDGEWEIITEGDLDEDCNFSR